MKKKLKALPVSKVIADAKQNFKPRKQYRDLKFPKLLYMTYVLTFPDGDVWVKQTEMVNDLAWNLQQLVAEKKTSEWKTRALALYHANECWWKDALNVEHLILIEETKRPPHQLRWGVSKEGLAEIKSGLTEEKKCPENPQ